VAAQAAKASKTASAGSSRAATHTAPDAYTNDINTDSNSGSQKSKSTTPEPKDDKQARSRKAEVIINKINK
jgi:hypothetical protein